MSSFLKIKISDDIKTIDRVFNYKLWYDGIKKFIAIRIK